MVKYFLAALGGALMPLAFAPVNWWWIAFVALLLLLYTWRDASPKQAFWLGIVYGIACYTVGLSWFASTVDAYFASGSLIAGAVTFIFICVLALFIALPGYVCKKIQLHYTPRSILLILPPCYVLFEYLRSWLFTGAPLYFLGLSQINSPLKNYAPIVGVYGVSWLTFIIASLCWILIESRVDLSLKRKPIYLALAVIWGLGAMLSQISWVKTQNTKFSVSTFQTNIPVSRKHILTHDLHRVTYLPLLNQSLGTDLIIWPELSIPWSQHDVPAIYTWLDDIGKQHKFTILVSGPIPIGPQYKLFYNSLTALGTANGVYHKQQLLPFGEYAPYRNLAHKIYQKFSYKPSYVPGPARNNALDLHFTQLSPSVCYELLYPESIRKSIRQSAANVIVNVGEDGWYSTVQMKTQNLDAARMRALETGRYVIRSANNGISAIINQRGEIVAKGDLGITKVVKATVENMQGFTPWVLLGARGLIALLFISILLGKWPSVNFQYTNCGRYQWIPFLK